MSDPRIEEFARIGEDVSIGSNTVIESFCVIGYRGSLGNPGPTHIGSDCHIRLFTIVYAGSAIGDRFFTGNKANIREHCTIGDDVSIGTLSVVEHHVVIGSRVRIHSQRKVRDDNFRVQGSGKQV